jgi:hypothetical protein
MAAPTITLTEAQGTFITFDAPGVFDTAFSGTYSVSINPAGEILGATIDSSGATTGFLRSSLGTFTTFNVSGATEYTYPFFGVGAFGSTLNPSSEATGAYFDANGTGHGFVRDPRGAITTFDAPGAVGETSPLSINPAGEVTGFYIDANAFAHSFLRDAKGNVTEFDAPGASTACFFGLTGANGINAAGEITGNYFDSSLCHSHGYLRERNGAFTVFDVPGFTQTFPLTINNAGKIAGWGYDPTGAGHGFLRDNRGFFTTFEVPNGNFVGSMQINPAGVIAGGWFDVHLVAHGFRRAADGTVTTFDVPGAGAGLVQGTFASSINPAGVITGYYYDANTVAHGFLFQPQ